MAKARQGKIINIASISAFLARDRRTYHIHNKMEQPVDYSAAKGGVVAVTKDLAAVMSQYGVYVNSISPGAFDKGDLPEGYAKAYRDKTPLGRMGRMGVDIKGGGPFCWRAPPAIISRGGYRGRRRIQHLELVITGLEIKPIGRFSQIRGDNTALPYRHPFIYFI